MRRLHPRRALRDRGFVLVNALILVAALAGIAAVLLARAEGARTRQAETQGAAQVTLYLDAFESLATALLEADGGPVDHAGEAWAQAGYDVPLDRGRVAGDIADMQGLFNVNWLANPSDRLARDGFEALLKRLGMSPLLGEKIAAFLGPGGPRDKSAYARQSPALRPVGGPVLFLDQLLDMPDLGLRAFDRLRPYLTALPGDKPLNLNTAPAVVLQSLLPDLGAVVADRLVQERRREPFLSVEDFIARAAAFGAGVVMTEEDMVRFGVGSDWFAVSIRAELGDHIRNRLTVLERRPLPAGVRVAYRLGGVP